MGTSLEPSDISGIPRVWETDASWLHRGIRTAKQSAASKPLTPRPGQPQAEGAEQGGTWGAPKIPPSHCSGGCQLPSWLHFGTQTP